MALRFDPAQKTYVNCGNDSSLDVYSKHTLVARVVMFSVPSVAGWIICRRKLVAPGYEGYGIVWHSSKVFHFFVGDGNDYSVFSSTLQLNTFYTAIQTFNGSTVKGYINNEYQGSVSGKCVSLNRDFAIGVDTYNYAVRYFDGIIYEVRVYNRVITPTEIEIITFSQGSDNIINGLVGWWRLDEKPDGDVATGTDSIIDLSGYGNHGTPVNNPIYRPSASRITRPPIIR